MPFENNRTRASFTPTMIVNPPNFDDLTWRAGFDSNMKAVFDRMDKATNDLKQVCPNVKNPSGS
ncbi:hypothetical protein [Mycobacteroides abscessus]|uniref:hypothetical protein n=1 Tax=Mycobacteroides abscessus TaxID=36809 RepID=UPI0021069952|nr:hypothetical protein [Mycobacteroides abscessus]